MVNYLLCKQQQKWLELLEKLLTMIGSFLERIHQDVDKKEVLANLSFQHGTVLEPTYFEELYYKLEEEEAKGEQSGGGKSAAKAIPPINFINNLQI